MNFLYIAHLLLLASAIKAFPLGDQSQHQESPLEWAPCELDGLDQDSIQVPIDCAKLAVPLDYTDPNGSEELQLQLLKINATKEPFLGSVLFNPGGPGASAVEDVAEKGHIYGE